MKTADVRIGGYYMCAVDGTDELVRVTEATTLKQTSARTWRTRLVPAFKIRAKGGRTLTVLAARLN